MRILLVNDDGIHSPGITALQDACAGSHEVWICAPDREKSGASHAISFTEAVRTRPAGEKSLAVSGTPADCVLAAFHFFMPVFPDLVVSGINIGANVGADIVYSGTTGAARQAVFLGVPGVAVSLNTFSPPYYLETAARFIADNAERFKNLWIESGDRAHFLNINVPNVERFEGSVHIASPAKLAYENRLESFTSARGETYSFYAGNKRVGIDEDISTDISLIGEGNIVVSPVEVYPALSETVGRYEAEDFVVTGGSE
jgi:5'-nucleotidase